MTDPRPRPQYGEYAPIDQTPVAPPPPAKVQDPAPEAVAPPRDVLFTTFLLAVGAFDVVTSWGQIADLPSALQTLYTAQGVGEYTSIGFATTVGLVANLLRATILVVVIVLSLVRIQRKRRAFWIPLIGGVAAAIVLMVSVTVAMLGDPALLAFLGSRAG